jgi:hypothetical protein
LNKADTSVFYHVAGTFDANNYNVSLTATTNGRMSSDGLRTRALNIGSGTWTLAASQTSWIVTSSLSISGTGTITLTSATAKTFNGGGLSYSGITLDQGGAGTLTISGNNTFKNITNSYGSTGATSIALPSTTQTVSQFTATGTSGKLLTITGTSTTSLGIIRYTGSSQTTSIDYLALTNIAFYVPNLYWYIGTNSTGSFSGAYLLAGSVVVTLTSNGNFFLFF